MYLLPITLKVLEVAVSKTGGPTEITFDVHDAENVQVRRQSITVGGGQDAGGASAILQTYATDIARMLRASGDAKIEDAEDRAESLASLQGREFSGGAL